MLHPALLDQLDHPPRIEVDAEADATAILRQVLDREPQPTRARGTEHQPVGTPREIPVGERVAEHLIVGAEVTGVDSRLRRARRATGLKHVHRLVGETLWHPPADGASTEPLILERRELLEVVEALHVGERIEGQALRILQPEGAARRLVKVPGHGLDGVRIECRAGLRHRLLACHFENRELVGLRRRRCGAGHEGRFLAGWGG